MEQITLSFDKDELKIEVSDNITYDGLMSGIQGLAKYCAEFDEQYKNVFIGCFLKGIVNILSTYDMEQQLMYFSELSDLFTNLGIELSDKGEENN